MTSLDVRAFHVLNHALSCGPWFWLFVFLSLVGGGWGAFLIVPLYLSKRMRPHVPALCCVIVVQALLVFGLKRLFARQRPHFADIKMLFLHNPTDYSFPSGHASGSFAFCVFLALVLVRTAPPGLERRRRLLAGGLVAFAVGVGLSRIALGAHYPGDVLVGALLGTVVATFGAQLHLQRHRRTSG